MSKKEYLERFQKSLLTCDPDEPVSTDPCAQALVDYILCEEDDDE